MFAYPTAPGRGAGPWLVSALLRAVVVVLGAGFAIASSGVALAQTSQPLTVSFPSADNSTSLTGYLFAPAGRPKVAPAVVLLHGFGGAYLPAARGTYNSVMLSRSLRAWAELWAAQGYWALVVDSFKPRGLPAGISSGATTPKPGSPGDSAVRALDAYGALRYLRASPRVRADRIALEGWTNGGSAVLASMSRETLAAAGLDRSHGFRAAIAMFPDCSPEAAARPAYAPYAPTHIFTATEGHDIGSACQKLAANTRPLSGELAVTILEVGVHGFDYPGTSRSTTAGTESAANQVRRQSLALFAATIGR